MSLLNNVLSAAFPSLEGTDPMVLGPVLALIACFAVIAIVGLSMAMHDFLSDRA